MLAQADPRSETRPPVPGPGAGGPPRPPGGGGGTAPGREGPASASKGGVRSFLLALAMHLLLFAMLFVGIRWQTQRPAAVQAELWSPPAPVTVAPPPPVEAPAPKPAPPPPRAVEPEPLPTVKPDIVLEREREEKARREAQERKEAQERRDAQAKKDALAKKEKEEKEKAAREKKLADEKKLAEEKKLALEKKLADEKREAEKRREAEKAQQAAAEKRHDDYVKRMVTEAGPSGERVAQGAASGAAAGGSAGASAGGAGGAGDAEYAARLGAMIRANTVFPVPADLAGNPKAIFLVSLLPDCSISTVKLRRSSGHAGWDAAAERGITRTDPFPRMPNGTCPRELEIARGPRDER